jgi:NADH-quinone oxidoreductase subunit F
MERPLTEHIVVGKEPLDRQGYERAGGYQALRKALGMRREQVIQEVKDADLRGRGGAGFVTGLKWSFVPAGDDAPRSKYVVVNADEMEPGAFKDRLLLEGNPHQLLEGTLLAAYAVDADAAYIFVRGEYTRAETVLRKALAEARQAGLVGRNILGSPWSTQVYLHMSAGRYICGEETALLNAMEGRRANPRAKPPFPPASGLWGKPTIINNVETLCCVPHIIGKGANWFKGLSRTRDGGTKLYGASGKVRRPGLWELPMGTPLREILHEHAGGMREGLRFRGLLPGGASTDFLVEEHLDTPMDFTEVQKAGSRLGTGTMIVLDDKTCPVGMVANLIEFFAQESCGWCTPCWSGLNWAARVLRSLEAGNGKPGDLDILQWQCQLNAFGNTFCALAPGAIEPLQSALKYFREDFERHIREGRCPWR